MEEQRAKASPEEWKIQIQRWLTASRMRMEKRLRYLAATRADWVRHKMGARFEPPLRVAGTRRQPRFFFLSREVPGICAAWRQRLEKEAAASVAQAERICQHRFDLLGYEDVACGAEIDWHCDHVHGSQAPLRPWFKLLRLLNQAAPSRAGDCRIVWELNRHQHLVTLAKAYRLTGNRKFAAEVFAQWEHWHRHNPYPLGLNWISTREIARRALSWLWVYFLLVNTPELPRGFRAEWLRALYLSGRHIERYALLHERGPASFLAEGVLLFFVGVLCPELDLAEDWKKRGWEIVLEEARSVVQGDAVTFQGSTWQQVDRADLLLHASILASVNEILVPPAYEAALEKTLEIVGLLGRAGAPPKLGAEEGGRLFDPQRNRPAHMLDPLATGAVLFGRGDFKTLAGALREEILWLLGEPGLEEFDHLESKPPQAQSVALPAAGLYLSTNAELQQQLVIDARPSPASSGSESRVHQDGGGLALSINQAGRALILDPGAVPAFFGDAELPGGLKNTMLFHPTIGHEINHRGADSREARVQVDAWISGQTFDLFAGSRALADGKSSLTHQRWVFSLHSEFWLVRDVAFGEGVRRLGVFWHLNPEALQHAGRAGMCVDTGGENGLRVLASDEHGWLQEVRQEFWCPVYGAREPLNLLQFSITRDLPAEFVTLLAPARNHSQAEGRLVSTIESSAQEPARAYRYEAEGSSHEIFFGQGQPWSFAGWQSDADFLYWGQSHDKARRLLICCNATHVEHEGWRVISSARKLERCELVIAGEQMDVFSSDADAKVSKRALDAPFAEVTAEGITRIPAQKRLKKAAGQ